MLQTLAELVGAILHGTGSTPGRPGERRAATPGEHRANLVIAIVLCVVLVGCLVGVVVGLVLAAANA